MMGELNMFWNRQMKICIFLLGSLIALSFSRVAANKEYACAPPYPRDCTDIPAKSDCGKYWTNPGLNKPVATYCNMGSNGGGWVVIMRRKRTCHKHLVDFDVNWDQYKWGFGSFSGEFWWGLEHVWYLTSNLDREYELRIDMQDFRGYHKYAVYQNFRISSEEDNYRLALGNYSGDAGNVLQYHQEPFSTKDHLSQEKSRGCASTFKGGWWYNSCYFALFTGVYGNSKQLCNSGGIKYFGPHEYEGYGRYNPLKEVTMFLRPTTKAVETRHGDTIV